MGCTPTFLYLPVKMEEAEFSETSAHKLRGPGNYPEESIRHSEQGESLKSRKYITCVVNLGVYSSSYIN